MTERERSKQREGGAAPTNLIGVARVRSDVVMRKVDVCEFGARRQRHNGRLHQIALHEQGFQRLQVRPAANRVENEQ
jgi:hypothetical protein